MNNELKDLVGRKITKIYLNEEYLRFDTEGGISYTYRVTGDCCSLSSFYDFYGVENVLKNGPVTEVKEAEFELKDLQKMTAYSEGRTYALKSILEKVEGMKRGNVITNVGSQTPEWQLQAHLMKAEYGGFNTALTTVLNFIISLQKEI